MAEREQRKRDRALLLWCLRARWGQVLGSILGGLVFQAAGIMFPWCLQKALDEGIVPRDQARTALWALAVVGVTLVLVLGVMVMLRLAVGATSRTVNEVNARLLGHILTLDQRALGRFGHGDLVIRGTRDIDLLRSWLSGFASMVTGLCGFVGIVVAIALLDPLMALVGIGTVPLILLVNIYYPRRFARANTELSSAHGSRADAVEDLLSASAAVRGIGGERPLVARHAQRSSVVTEHTLHVARIAANWESQGPAIPAIGTGIGLAVGGLAVLDGGLSIGALVAFSSWMTMLATWVGVLTNRLTQLSQAYTAARRINEVVETRPELVDPETPAPLPPSGALEAEGVEIRRDGQPFLGPVDLRVEPGELVVVTGGFGTGKSLLLRLLCRLEAPDAGAISYGGTDVRSVALGDLHTAITLVPQRPIMVTGTVAENLRLGRDDIDDEQMRDACRIAGIDAYLQTLPAGYDSEVGEQGSTLSGGQVQRLALGRAILHGARVLLLDDVTSAIDVDTEGRVLPALEEWLRRADGRAVVFVSHRPAVIAAADRLVRLPDREDGPPSARETTMAGELGG